MLETFRIDRNSLTPMNRQLYTRIRQDILRGQLAPGLRLPSTRELATQLDISRNVVLEAYDQLLAEGFVRARHGSGTYVAPDATLFETPAIAKPNAAEITMGYDCPDGVINFRAGTPQLELFPHKLWLRMIREVLDSTPGKKLAYGRPEGERELREAICSYVVNQREVLCHPDQLIITGGTTQAINICCGLLLGTRKDIVIEDPITRDIQEIAAKYGARLHPVSVDSDGLQTGLLPPELAPALVYVTPSHQFPIGGTLPIQRRLALIRYAKANGCHIIEDDYDSEFRFDGPPLGSLHGLDPHRVLYIGTFSKTLCPAIRIGYLVLPPDLIETGRKIKWQSDLHNEVISQLALARFISGGHYLRHVAKMRKHYKQLRDHLETRLTSHFGKRVEILGSRTGLHLVAHFPGRHFDNDFFRSAEAAGARFYPVSLHAFNHQDHAGKLLIGYGSLTREEIARGIAILARTSRIR